MTARMTGGAAWLGGMLRAQRRGGGTALDLCAAVLQDAGSAGCVVAVTRPGSHLDLGLAGLVGGDRLFRHTPMPDATDTAFRAALGVQVASTASPAVLLADRDRDVPAPPMRPWAPSLTARPLRLRRADTLYADSHRIDLLAIEDGREAPAILRGARRLLAGQAPAVVIDLATIPPAERPAVWEACVQAAGPVPHTWRDSLLLPCDAPDRRGDTLLVCAERVICALPPHSRLAPLLPEGLAGMVAPESAGLAALAWGGWRSAPAGADAALNRAAISVPFDDALPAANLHPAETDGHGGWWRWTGPGARAGFAMPAPGPGRWRLRFEVMAWGAAEHAGRLQVFAGGVPLTLRPSAGAVFGDIALTAQSSGRLRVEIITPPPRRASADDPRRIGVNLSRATLEPAA